MSGTPHAAAASAATATATEECSHEASCVTISQVTSQSAGPSPGATKNRSGHWGYQTTRLRALRAAAPPVERGRDALTPGTTKALPHPGARHVVAEAPLGRLALHRRTPVRTPAALLFPPAVDWIAMALRIRSRRVRARSTRGIGHLRAVAQGVAARRTPTRCGEQGAEKGPYPDLPCALRALGGRHRLSPRPCIRREGAAPLEKNRAESA